MDQHVGGVKVTVADTVAAGQGGERVKQPSSDRRREGAGSVDLAFDPALLCRDVYVKDTFMHAGMQPGKSPGEMEHLPWFLQKEVQHGNAGDALVNQSISIPHLDDFPNLR